MNQPYHPNHPPLPQILIAPIAGEHNLTSEISEIGMVLIFNGLSIFRAFPTKEIDNGMKNRVQINNEIIATARIHTVQLLSVCLRAYMNPPHITAVESAEIIML